MGRLAFGVVLALSAPLLVPTSTAQADEEVNQDDVDRAKQFFRSGQELYNAKRYEQAIVAWQESYKLSKYPVLLFNIANAAEKIENYELALEMLDAYRVHAKPEEKNDIARRIRDLEEALEASLAPEPEPEPEPEPVAQVETVPENPLPAVVVPNPAVASLLSVTAAPPKKLNPTGPVLVGVGVAGLGAGVGFNVLGRQLRGDLEGSTAFVNDLYWPSPDQAREVNTLNTYNTLFYVSTAVGAASLITGSILWAVQSKKKSNLKGVALAPVFTPRGELGLNAAGRF